MEPGFWNDQNNAKKISQELSHLIDFVKAWEDLAQDCKGLSEMLPEIHPEEDPKSAEEFVAMVADLEKRFIEHNRETFMSGKYDHNGAILSFHAGTGGKDAQDWAEMLFRMYTRYAEVRGWKAELLDKSDGEEVGIKSASILISGPYAYGYLRGEKGVHRLVRLSPFNAKNSRETSFALVDVIPEIEIDSEVEIKKEDLEFEAFRSGGAGGQNVNKVSSAVRLKHIPTGLVVTCQTARSQVQNKERAMKMLYSKLMHLKEEEHAEELSEIKGVKTEMSWGNQIRSYVLHPYTMVKDHRTDYETSQVDKVLDGDLEGFIEAEIEWLAKNAKKE